MINAAIADTHKKLDVVVIDGPWTAPNGTTWKIGIHPADSTDFKLALKQAGIKPCSLKDRTDSLSDVDYSGGLGNIKTKKLLARASEQAQERLRVQQELAKAVRVELEDIDTVGYELADYPTSVLSVGEVKTLRDDIAKCLVDGVTEVAPDGGEDVWPVEKVTKAFTSTDPVPDTVERDDDGATYVESLYMRGSQEGVALCAYVYRHAVQTHLFLERRVPLENS